MRRGTGKRLMEEKEVEGRPQRDRRKDVLPVGWLSGQCEKLLEAQLVILTQICTHTHSSCDGIIENLNNRYTLG